MELRFFSFCYSTILCKQQHQDNSCTCTWVSSSNLSHLPDFTHLCIKFHDNNFRPIVWLWKPFHRHFAHFRRRWDSKASIINTFTTFLLLSFSKILFVSFTLLYTIRIEHDLGGVIVQEKCALYYDPSVDCHSQEFTILAALAVCVLVIFIVCPTILLIIYPTRLFRRCVSCCGFRRWHALRIFVESFQGQYKDGTSGSRDFRVVSASFLILRILILALSLKRHFYSWNSFVHCVLLVTVLCFHAVTRPYKLNFATNVDILILFLLAMSLQQPTFNSKGFHMGLLY